MRKIFILAKTLLKGGGSFSSEKKEKSKWLMIVLLAFAFLTFAASTMFLTVEIYDVLDAGGAADIIIPIAFGATCFVVFFFGIFYVISTMYHANDIELLLTLPLRPFQILGAKFVTLIVYEYIMESFILLPILVAFGIKSGAGVMYIVYSAILLLITPVIALSIAGVIVMIVMRFTSFGKNKQVFKFVGGIIALAVALGFNVLLQTSMRNLGAMSPEVMAAGGASLVSLVSNIFPGIIFAANTLIYSHELAGLGNLALFIVCSGIAAAIFLGVGQLVYFKGVTGVTETSAKREAISASEFGKQTASVSSFAAYAKKEVRLLMRSPIAFLNCVVVNFMWPILILIMMASGGSTSHLTQLLKGGDSAVVLAIIIGLCAFVASSNSVTSTAISREGKTLYFSKFIPLDMSKQLQAKVLVGFLLSLIGIIMVLVIGFVLGLETMVAIVALVVSLPMVGVCSLTGILIDASRPKLNWVNEQQAIKQNLNVLLHMLTGLLYAAIAILPVIFARMSFVIAGIYMAAVFGVLVLVLRNRVNNAVAVKLDRMDA